MIYKIKCTLFTWLILGSLSSYAAYSCSIAVSSNNAAYGNYNPLSYAALTTTTSIDTTCSITDASVVQNISYTITLSQGNSASFANRIMKNGTKTLSYNLYTDSGYTKIFGDGTSGTYTVSNTGTLTRPSLTSATTRTTFYAKIPSQPTVAVGNYTDSIISTVTWN